MEFKLNEYTTIDIQRILGINRQRLREWIDGDYIMPSINRAYGIGTKNIFSRWDLYGIEIFKKILETDISRAHAGRVYLFWNLRTKDLPVEERHKFSKVLYIHCTDPYNEKDNYKTVIKFIMIDEEKKYKINSISEKNYPNWIRWEIINIARIIKEVDTDKLKEEPHEPGVFETLPARPTKMKLKGEMFILRNAYEILINTANWLISNGKLTLSNCPVSIGRGNRYLINKEPIHSDNKSFTQPHKLSNGLFIETHASTSNIVDQARRLLKQFGISSDILTLE